MSDEQIVDYRAKTGKENKCVLCEGTTVAGFTPSLTTRFPNVWACYEVEDIRFNLCPEHNNPIDYSSMEKLVQKMWINKMRIRCSRCGQPVSSVEVSSDTIIRAWVECPECMEKEQESLNVIDEYICKMYSSSGALKLKSWVRENLSPEQIESLKETVEKINEIRKEKRYDYK